MILKLKKMNDTRGWNEERQNSEKKQKKSKQAIEHRFVRMRGVLSKLFLIPNIISIPNPNPTYPQVPNMQISLDTIQQLSDRSYNRCYILLNSVPTHGSLVISRFITVRSPYLTQPHVSVIPCGERGGGPPRCYNT